MYAFKIFSIFAIIIEKFDKMIICFCASIHYLMFSFNINSCSNTIENHVFPHYPLTIIVEELQHNAYSKLI